MGDARCQLSPYHGYMKEDTRNVFRDTSGFALAVVLLVAVVALVAATGAATLAVTSGRSATVQERRTTDALLAAESGINTLPALARAAGVFGSATSYEAGDIADWLMANDGERASATFDNGAGYTLRVFEEAGTDVFTVRSTGTGTGGTRQVVIQDFRVAVTSRADSIGSAGAVVTQQGFGMQGAAMVTGRSADSADWIWLAVRLSDGFPGEYFILDVDGEDVLYRIASRTFDGATFELVNVADGTTLTLPGDTVGDLIPFAVAQDVTVPSDTTFAVSTTVLYTPGMTIFVGDFQGTVTDVDPVSRTLSVAWDGDATGTIDEAAPIRARVPSAVFDDGRDWSEEEYNYIVLPDADCPTSGASTLTDGCAVADLSNLWYDTFGTLEPSDMLGLARCDSDVLAQFTSEQLAYLLDEFGQCTNSYYGPNPDLGAVAEWPSGELSGVTWVDGASTGNFQSRGGGSSGGGGRAICGSGVVVLNTGVFAAGDESTDGLQINVSDCDFSGVLYIIGDVNIQGNIDSLSGTVIIQTADTTNVRGGTKGPPGTSDKAIYDPVAVRRALNQLPRDMSTELRVVALPATFRFGQ